MGGPTRRLAVFGIAAILLATRRTGGDQPWFGRPQFLNYSSSYSLSGFVEPDLLARVPFTGQAWGLYLPSSFGDGPLQAEIARWRATNPSNPYIASSNPNNLYLSSVATSDWDLFRMRTLDGRYLGDAAFNPSGPPPPRYTLSSLSWRGFLKEQARRAVDIGANGLLFDEIQGQLLSMLYLGPRAAGSFDTVTMAAFRTWLRQRYDAATLMNRFMIADISALDFGQYVLANGLGDSWNALPLSGLPAEFFRFRRSEILDFLRDLSSSTKDYARQRYGRDFAISANGTFDPLAFFARDVIDYTTNEAFYIRGAQMPFAAADIKAALALRKPVLPLPEAFPPALGVTDPLNKPTVNLIRVIIADIQASGAIPGSPVRMNSTVLSPQPIDLNVVNRYATFILSNGQILTNLTTPARIALVESAPSTLGGIIASPAEPNPWVGRPNYLGTAQLLIDNGFTYDSVFFPDTTYSTLPWHGGRDLSPYGVVIAPSLWALADAQVSGLLDFARRGGTLVAMGSLGTSQPDASPAARPELALPLNGSVAYGLGRIIRTQTLFGALYQNGTLDVRRQTNAAFLEFLRPLAQRDVQIDGVTALIHEPGVTPFFYLDQAGQPVVHLVNYDYDEKSDQFFRKANFTVTVRVGSAVVDEVVMQSPDMDGTRSLEFTRSGDAVTLKVSDLEAWAVLSFRRK